MGREIRRVPATWKHPKDDSGRYIPLLSGSYLNASEEWEEEYVQWHKGMRRDYSATGNGWIARESDELSMCCTDYYGRRPSPDDYMPNWPESERTHIQMYESTSEGTPISPAYDNPQDLARWLADTGASAFGSSTASYEEWLSMCERGWAPSGMVTSIGIVSGVAGLYEIDKAARK